MNRLNTERRISAILVALLLCAGSVGAQKAERKNVRDGNKQYRKDNYTEAEVAYRKSIEVNPRSAEGVYNLGNALYRQEKYPEAAEQYQLLAGQGERLMQEDPDNNAQRLAHVFHNLGNIGMKTQEYQKSVDAYKQSLRLNPIDDETRYNLALAQKLLKDQQQQEQNQDQNQDQDQQEQEQNQQEQNKDQQNEQKKTQEEQQQNEQMSRDNAQQILDAFLQDEKDTQEKVKKAQMEKQQSRKREKQW
ncbi:MAG: tetratricopeptide repeat protein [Tannerella sp.]|nr:tetratricopeptide repeat protein [Tannerella sp.]